MKYDPPISFVVGFPPIHLANHTLGAIVTTGILLIDYACDGGYRSQAIFEYSIYFIQQDNSIQQQQALQIYKVIKTY